MKPTLIVLAAGMGSRYGGLKQMDTVGPSGETIVDYVIHDAIKAGFEKIVFVIRKEIKDDFLSTFYESISKHVEVRYVFQELSDLPDNLELPEDRVKPWGTAHAVWSAREAVNEPFAIVNADDYYGQNSLKLMYDHLVVQDNSNLHGCMVGYILKNTLSEHGKVSRGICEMDDQGSLVSITERTDIYKEKNGCYYIEEDAKFPLRGNETVSMNLVGFTSPVFEAIAEGFKKFYAAITNNKQEYGIPTILDSLKTLTKGIPVLPSSDVWFGVTYKEDKALVESKIKELVAKGEYPSDLWE